MNYLLTVSYNGTAYFGFERQKKLPSIQKEIEKALSTILGYEMTIHGSGRTDKGVHASGQKCNFKPGSPIEDTDKFLFALNRLLPKDIVATSIEEKDDSFDSRHSARKKIYTYRFHQGQRNPFAVDEYQLEFRDFDFTSFEKAMLLFKGKHDFRNFTTKPEDKDGFIRDIEEISFDLKDDHMQVTLSANGFMTYMVRTMVGVALRVGEGKMTVKEAETLLETPKRNIVSFKADPKGLCLVDVLY